MIRHHFKQEISTFGRILRPVAEVVLEHGDIRVGIPMYVDSGADISMIPLRLGRSLGFKQEEGDTIRQIKGVSGVSVPYILKKVTLVLNGKRLEIRIAWALMEEVPIIMGRMDIFNRFCIVFDERKECIDFKE